MYEARGSTRFMHGLVGRKSRMLVLSVLIGGTAAVALASAAVPPARQSPAVIRACVSKRTGVIRISNRCRKGERRLLWNVHGPQGPVGPRGAAGATGLTGSTGPKGDQGAPGPSGGTGPHGPRGDVGANGSSADPGDQGPEGETGAGGAARKDGAPAQFSNGQPNTAVASNASCDAGKTLVGGGFEITGDVKKAIVTASMPSKKLANTWTAAAVAISSNADISITAYAICA